MNEIVAYFHHWVFIIFCGPQCCFYYTQARQTIRQYVFIPTQEMAGRIKLFIMVLFGEWEQYEEMLHREERGIFFDY